MYYSIILWWILYMFELSDHIYFIFIELSDIILFLLSACFKQCLCKSTCNTKSCYVTYVRTGKTRKVSKVPRCTRKCRCPAGWRNETEKGSHLCVKASCPCKLPDRTKKLPINLWLETVFILNFNILPFFILN